MAYHKCAAYRGAGDRFSEKKKRMDGVRGAEGKRLVIYIHKSIEVYAQGRGGAALAAGYFRKLQLGCDTRAFVHIYKLLLAGDR